jgi:hypothetical protein
MDAIREHCGKPRRRLIEIVLGQWYDDLPNLVERQKRLE